MLYNQYYNKKKIANLDLYQYNNNSVISPRILSYKNDVFLGSIWFFPEYLPVDSIFGIADNTTMYNRNEHYQYFRLEGYKYTQGTLVDFMPYTMTAPKQYGYTTEWNDERGGSPGYAIFTNENAYWSWHTNNIYPVYTSIIKDSASGETGVYILDSVYVQDVREAGYNFPVYSFYIEGFDYQKSIWIKLTDTIYMPSSGKITVKVATNSIFCSGFKYIITSGHYATTGKIKYYCYEYGGNALENMHFLLPNLQYLAPAGFKTYIYIGN